MLWIMKHSLLGKVTQGYMIYWHFIEHACVMNPLALNVVLTHRDMTSFTTQLRLFDLSSFYEKY